jgi:hypothetical protein
MLFHIKILSLLNYINRDKLFNMRRGFPCNALRNLLQNKARVQKIKMRRSVIAIHFLRTFPPADIYNIVNIKLSTEKYIHFLYSYVRK